METDKSRIVAFTLGAVILVSIANLAFAQESVTRTVILKQSLEADPTKEVTVFVFELKPGGRTGKHYHPGQEFIYVLEGEGRIEEAGKPPVDLKPGAGVYFSSRTRPSQPMCTRASISVRPSL